VSANAGKARGRFAGKVVLITGTAGGQGRTAALLFAAEGGIVVGTDLNAAGAVETVEMVRAAGGQMHSTHPLDIVLLVTRHSWRYLVARGGGSVLLVGSTAGPRQPGQLHQAGHDPYAGHRGRPARSRPSDARHRPGDPARPDRRSGGGGPIRTVPGLG
jgi:NAD(P)-dependent dehydrogenase (short-subunit alcohol dehydrogenase family)